jgi:hypothetical protein
MRERGERKREIEDGLVVYVCVCRKLGGKKGGGSAFGWWSWGNRSLLYMWTGLGWVGELAGRKGGRKPDRQRSKRKKDGAWMG